MSAVKWPEIMGSP